MKTTKNKRYSCASAEGSVLVMVIWILFGLVAITLYFGNSMSLELRASDNRVAGEQAELAVEAARRYISLVLSNNPNPGSMLSPNLYQCAAVPVGDAHFWLIGRTNSDNAPASVPTWGLIDEASKINLNTAGSNVLYWVPRMTPELLNSIIAWRSSSTNATAINSGGAESETYLRLQPAYNAKNAPFETLGELRMIYNMDMVMLFGEDPNLNGILDPNENDGEKLPPADDQDGKLDPGFFEFFTIYSQEPTVATNGTARYNLTTQAGVEGLYTNLVSQLGQTRAIQLFGNALMLQQQSNPTTNSAVNCPLLFYVASKMTQAEFAPIEPSIRGSSIKGLVNVNTASSTVLACLMDGDTATATQLVNYRAANQANALNSNTVSWVSTVITDTTILAKLAPRITGLSYQCTADVAALGHDGRGYRRARFVYDTVPMVGTNALPPMIVYRQDLTDLGWSLGKQVRDRWVLGKKTS